MARPESHGTQAASALFEACGLKEKIGIAKGKLGAENNEQMPGCWVTGGPSATTVGCGTLSSQEMERGTTRVFSAWWAQGLAPQPL